MSTRTRRRSSGFAAMRFQQRIQVLTLAFPSQHPGLVIDAGRPVVDIVERNVDELAQPDHRPVHRVAETQHLQLRCDVVQEGDVHGHGVGVVEQPRVRADLRHVRGDAGEHRKGPQPPEDSADADGVADGLVQAVAGRDVEIAHGGVVHPHLDHIDDVVGAVQCTASVEGRDDFGVRLGRACGRVRDPFRRLEPLGVDVVQDDAHRGQLGKREDVAEQLAGEHDTACSDDHDRWFHGGHYCAFRAHRSIMCGPRRAFVRGRRCAYGRHRLFDKDCYAGARGTGDRRRQSRPGAQR